MENIEQNSLEEWYVPGESSLEQAIENGKELIEFFKDKWSKEEYEKQVKLQELSEYNLSLWENDNEKKNKDKSKEKDRGINDSRF